MIARYSSQTPKTARCLFGQDAQRSCRKLRLYHCIVCIDNTSPTGQRILAWQVLITEAKSCTPLSGYRLLRPHARRIGTGEAAPEQIKDMPFSASRIKRLPRDVAATIATDLPESPRHRSSVLIKCQIFHIPLGDADVINNLRPMFTASPSTQPSENQRYLCDTNSKHWN